MSIFKVPRYQAAALLTLCAVALSAQTFSTSTSDPQKVMHIENYEPLPGDTYQLIIDFGGTQRAVASYSVMLQDDYVLELPYLGSFNAKNMNFAQLRSTIVNRIRSIVPLQYISFTLATPSRFDVFVFGRMKTTGFVTVNSLTRLSDVLAAAGGFVPTSSTRTIEITRKNVKTVYDLVSYQTLGKTEQNPYLKPGDRIFVPQKTLSVVLSGAVANPGEYEFLPGETLSTVMLTAGGLTPTASPEEIRILRLGERNGYETYKGTVDPESFKLQEGDRISFGSTLENVDLVTVEGAVFGSPVKADTIQAIPVAPQRLRIPYHPGFTLLELLETIGGPTPLADIGKAYIIRGKNGERSPLPDLASFWREKDSSRDLLLEPGDYLVIPLKKLKVFVAGEVYGPGAFDYVEGFTVMDYLTLAGGIVIGTGSSNSIYFVDDLGKKTKAGISSPVAPGSRIVVDMNAWGKTKSTLSNVVTIMSWITAITTAIFGLNRIAAWPWE